LKPAEQGRGTKEGNGDETSNSKSWLRRPFGVLDSLSMREGQPNQNSRRCASPEKRDKNRPAKKPGDEHCLLAKGTGGVRQNRTLAGYASTTKKGTAQNKKETGKIKARAGRPPLR